jgi:hypothetical protein
MYNYMPMTVQHQSQSQLMHHALPQNSLMTGRGGVNQPTGVPPQKLATNKVYNQEYWGPN